MVRLLAVLLALAILVLAAMRAFGSEAQLQTWIDEAIEAGGGEVTIPHGTLIIEKGIRIQKAENLRLIGLDPETVILIPGDELGDTPLLQVSDSKGVRVEKITFRGRDERSAPLVRLVGDSEEPAPILVSRCLFEESGGTGLRVDSAHQSLVETNSFRDLKGTAIEIRGGSAVGLHQNWITRCDTAISIGEDSRQVKVRANEISDCKERVIDASGQATIEDNGSN